DRGRDVLIPKIQPGHALSAADAGEVEAAGGVTPGPVDGPDAVPVNGAQVGLFAGVLLVHDVAPRQALDVVEPQGVSDLVARDGEVVVRPGRVAVADHLVPLLRHVHPGHAGRQGVGAVVGVDGTAERKDSAGGARSAQGRQVPGPDVDDVL